MVEPDLNFLARQFERVLSKINILQAAVDLMRRDIMHAADDIGMVKSDLQGMRHDLFSMRAEIAEMRNDFGQKGAGGNT